MDDIVARLRQFGDSHGLDAEAADEIERLRTLLDRAYVLAVGHGFDSTVWESIEDAIEAYENAKVCDASPELRQIQ